MGELGQTGEGPAFLARDRSTHELVAVRADTAGGVSVMNTLNSSVPTSSRDCPICRTPISDWRRFCDQCGSDLSGVDVAPEGLDARRVVEEILRTSNRPVDLFGPMKRSEGGGDVWFGSDRQTGEILALDLRRQRDSAGAGGYSVEVTAVIPGYHQARGGTRARPAAPPRSTASSESKETAPIVKLCPSCGREYGGEVRFCPDDGSVLRLRDVSETLVGEIIADRYLIHRKIGQGGMGQVYQAEHVRMGQKCAIKVLSRELSNDVQAVSRFAREATNASRINDIHVAHIYDFGESPQHGVYLAMEYVEGEPLARIIAAAGSIPDRRAVDIATQVAAALVAAHAEGVVHRDLTPNNIMIARAHDGSDLVKVVDFGIAKATDDLGGGLTRTGFVIGTPQYMSPEQLLAEPVDRRSDIYQLGCVMFEMLTGSPPFGSTGGADQITKRLTGGAPRPIEKNAKVSPALSDIVTKALSRSREERYQTAAELRSALTGVGGASPVSRTVAGDRAAEQAVEPPGAGDRTAAVSGSEPPPSRSRSRTPVPSAPASPPPPDADTMIQENPLVPPPLSVPRRTGPKPEPSTGATDVTRVAEARGGRGAPQAGEDATLLSRRPESPRDAAQTGRRRYLVVATTGFVSLAVLLTVIGTVWNPIHVGPMTFGFGAKEQKAGPGPGSPPPVAAEPAGGQTADDPVPEPVGIRLGSVLPAGATLLADGERVAAADGFILLSPGPHEMEVRATGYRPVHDRVVVDASRPVAWSPRLERLAVESQTSPAPGRRADTPPTTQRDPAGAAGQVRSQAEPPPIGQSPAPSLPVAFSVAASERIESFRQALASKDLSPIRRYLTQDRLREFGDVINRSGSTPIRVTARDIVLDSARSRATFLLRIDEVAGATLLPFGEFVAEFQRSNGAWQLFAIDRRQ